MGRFSKLVSSEHQQEPENVVQPEPEIIQNVDVYEELQKYSSDAKEDMPATPEEAIEKNLLFSKKTYLKQFEPEPEPPKKLNPGQSLFRHKLLKQPDKTDKFTSNPPIRATKDPKQPFVPVQYTKRKNLRSSKIDVPVEEVVQEFVEPGEEMV